MIFIEINNWFSYLCDLQDVYYSLPHAVFMISTEMNNSDICLSHCIFITT